ncbi:MAG: hypothetical protein KUG79_00060 [Pseudomonadales bacterium]|nr:hypothetical protein [Pseudomonadales bacterium]
MSGTINQMQVVYVAEEDRILFRVSSTDSQEFRFWLTQRYTNLLLKVLADHVNADPDISTQDTVEAKRAVKNFKQEKAISEANFSKPFAAQPSELPLGNEVLLAYRLTFNLQAKNLHLGIQPKEGQGINMVINRQINTSLVKLLLAAADKGQWNVAQSLEKNQMAGQQPTIN